MKKIYIDSFYTLVLVFAVMLLFPVIYSFDLLKSFQEALTDFNITDSVYSSLKEDKASLHASDDRIVIVDTDGISKQGVARLLNQINKQEPRVIGVDKIFQRSEKKIRDYFLANTLEDIDNIVLSGELMIASEKDSTNDWIQNSDSIFLEHAVMGYNNLLIDQDRRISTVREFYPKYKIDSTWINSFAVQVAQIYAIKKIEKIEKRNRKKEIIYYRGNFANFHYEDGINILSGEVEIDYFKDKIVLLGDVGRFRGYRLIEDLYYTPLNERYSGRTFPDMTGLEIQANIISRIIDGEYVDEMPNWVALLIAVVLCYINIVLFSLISIKNKKWFEVGTMLIFLAESLVIIGLTIWAYSTYQYQLRLNIALIAIAISVFAYQFYNESVKTIIVLIYNKFKKS
jgi:CHASE2 domain-containing sensor protein